MFDINVYRVDQRFFGFIKNRKDWNKHYLSLTTLGQKQFPSKGYGQENVCNVQFCDFWAMTSNDCFIIFHTWICKFWCCLPWKEQQTSPISLSNYSTYSQKPRDTLCVWHQCVLTNIISSFNGHLTIFGGHFSFLSVCLFVSSICDEQDLQTCMWI